VTRHLSLICLGFRTRHRRGVLSPSWANFFHTPNSFAPTGEAEASTFHSVCGVGDESILISLSPSWTAPFPSLQSEGMDKVVARHHRLAEGTRKAVEGWGLQLLCKDPRWRSDSLTVIEVPQGIDSNLVVKNAYARWVAGPGGWGCVPVGHGVSIDVSFPLPMGRHAKRTHGLKTEKKLREV